MPVIAATDAGSALAPLIPSAGPSDLGLDQRRLHALGLEHARRLSRRIWSDYNVHDPGYTALELAAYALTDLTSRAQWPVEDLLAGAGGGPAAPLFTARTILPNRPLTALDYRKLLIDLETVKNAWILPLEELLFVDPATGTVSRERPAGRGIRELRIRGLYRVLLEFMEDATDEAKTTAIADARTRFHQNRNLCEDLVDVAGVEQQLFRLCGEIEIAPEADAARMKAEVLFEVQRYLTPPVRNYTLSEMLERKHRGGEPYTVQEIFEGPALQTGFYDDRELLEAELRTEIRLSDIIARVMAIPGVRAIRELLISPMEQDVAIEKWVVPVNPGHQPVLHRLESRLVFYKRYLPIVPPDAPTDAAYDALVKAERAWLEGTHADDIPIPAGRDRQAGRYYSFQNHFPAVYGIGEDELSLEGLSDAQRAHRQAQIRQLKGYLLFLDQLMANYCAQLSNAGKLFSADPTVRRSYFGQAVEIRDADNLYAGAAANRVEAITALLENDDQGAERRNHFLDHLIARFAEKFHEYASTMHSLFGANSAALIDPKCAFLKDYQELSSRRGLAYDYTLKSPAGLWDSDNVSGFELRVGRLLDLREIKRRDLSDVEEDGFATVVADGPEFVWQITDRGDAPTVLLKSRGKFATEALARQALRDALHRGQQRSSYELKVAADGRSFFTLTGEDGTVLALQFCASPAECDATVRRLWQHLTHWYGEEGMYVVENLLLRMEQPGDPPLPVCPDPDCTDCPGDDPYSYRLHVILPAYGGRFATMEFRRFVEDLLREETPAHILPKICWIGRDDMRRFEKAYRDWLGIRSGENDGGREDKLKAFIAALYEVRNVYPAGILKACARGEDPQRFILGRSALGTLPPRDE